MPADVYQQFAAAHHSLSVRLH